MRHVHGSEFRIHFDDIMLFDANVGSHERFCSDNSLCVKYSNPVPLKAHETHSCKPRNKRTNRPIESLAVCESRISTQKVMKLTGRTTHDRTLACTYSSPGRPWSQWL